MFENLGNVISALIIGISTFFTGQEILPQSSSANINEWRSTDPFINNEHRSHPLPSFAINDYFYVHTDRNGDGDRIIYFARQQSDGSLGPWAVAEDDHGGGPHGYTAVAVSDTAYHFRNGHIGQYVLNQDKTVNDIILLESNPDTAFSGNKYVWDSAVLADFPNSKIILHLGGFSFSGYVWKNDAHRARYPIPANSSFERIGEVPLPGGASVEVVNYKTAFYRKDETKGFIYLGHRTNNRLYRAQVDSAGNLSDWRDISGLPEGTDNNRGDFFIYNDSFFVIRGKKVFKNIINPQDGTLGSWDDSPADLPEAQIDDSTWGSETEGASFGIIGNYVYVTGNKKVFYARLSDSLPTNPPPTNTPIPQPTQTPVPTNTPIPGQPTPTPTLIIPSPTPTHQSQPSATPIITNPPLPTSTIAPTPTSTVACGYYTLNGLLFRDQNSNGTYDLNEEIITNGRVKLTGINTLYDWTSEAVQGQYYFENLIQGTYLVSSPEIEGWKIPDMFLYIGQECPPSGTGYYKNLPFSLYSNPTPDPGGNNCPSNAGCPLKSRGDANCDQKINRLDFDIFIRHFGRYIDPTAEENANFYCIQGKNETYPVDLNDYEVLRKNIDHSSLPWDNPITPVPTNANGTPVPTPTSIQSIQSVSCLSPDISLERLDGNQARINFTAATYTTGWDPEVNYAYFTGSLPPDNLNLTLCGLIPCSFTVNSLSGNNLMTAITLTKTINGRKYSCLYNDMWYPDQPAGYSVCVNGCEKILSFTNPTSTPTSYPPSPTTAPSSPTPTQQPIACPNTSSNSYSRVVVDRSRPYQFPNTVQNNPDININLRGYARVNESVNLVTYNNVPDPKAPQLSTVFTSPQILSTYQMYEWDWNNNRPGTLMNKYPVTLVAMTGPNQESVKFPQSGYIIDGNTNTSGLVLFADENIVTITIKRNDNIIEGYTLHFTDFCTDPNLINLYRNLDNNGRTELPAVRTGQILGSRKNGEVKVSVRDVGEFLDPRSKGDWWRGY